MRYFLDISYNGMAYHGWQIQPNAHTVQAELEEALTNLLRTETDVLGSGRTDTGVHASQQIAHFDSAEDLDLEQFVYKLNKYLTANIAINGMRQVQPDAHARFDALERAYRYVIKPNKSPFGQNLSYYFSRPLDVEAMNQAAEKLLGKQDFESFSRVKTEVNNFICTINHAQWQTENDSLVFSVSANRFLRGMVRALVGTLLEVGLGKMTVGDFVEVIKQKDRRAAGRAVPPQGLYLCRVKYPDELFIS